MRVVQLIRLTAILILVMGCSRTETTGAVAGHPEARQSAASAAPVYAGSETKEIPSLPVPRKPVTRSPNAYQTFEAPLLVQGGLSVDAAERVMTENFDDHFRKFRESTLRDVDAVALTQAYRAQMVRAHGQLRLGEEEFACGLSLCMGRAHVRNEAEFEAWRRALENDRSIRFGSWLDATGETRPDGMREKRFLFSFDPSADGLTSRR